MAEKELRQRAEELAEIVELSRIEAWSNSFLISKLTTALSQVVEDCARVADKADCSSCSFEMGCGELPKEAIDYGKIADAIRRLASGEGEKT